MRKCYKDSDYNHVYVELALLVRVCLWWFPALVSACLCMPDHDVSGYEPSRLCDMCTK